MTLTGLKSAPRPEDVTGHALSTYLRRTGASVSSNVTAARCGAVPGSTSRGAFISTTAYGGRLDALRKRVHETYYNPEKRIYSKGTQVQLAFARLAGIAPDELRPAIAASLQREIRDKGYLDMGSSGLPVLFKHLIEGSGHSDLLFDPLIRTDEPSYGHFLERGETTWPENWSVDVPSRIHTCYTGVSSWFTKSLAGIQPDPALRRRPQVRRRPDRIALRHDPQPLGEVVGPLHPGSHHPAEFADHRPSASHGTFRRHRER